MKQVFIIACVLLSFVSKAQTVCDSVDIVSVRYSPFTDTLIIVEVVNENTDEIFNYPGFVILDSNGDTLAVETVNYFGIGDESIHTLNVREGVHSPLSNFEGRLELHTELYDVLNCDWSLDQSLCSSSPCETVFIGFQNFGGALVVGNFHWQVEDELGMVADSGSFTMEAQEQFWLRELCLPPGNFAYSLTALTSPSGGGPTLTVQSSLGFASPTLSEPLDWFNNPGAVLEFPFFTYCGDSPNFINDEVQEDLSILEYNPVQNTLSCSDNMNLIQIFSASGELVHSISSNSNMVQIPDLSSGIYVAVAATKNGESRIKFMCK